MLRLVNYYQTQSTDKPCGNLCSLFIQLCYRCTVQIRTFPVGVTRYNVKSGKVCPVVVEIVERRLTGYIWNTARMAKSIH